MSKRLIRIRNKEGYQNLEKYVGTEVNAILQNGNTHFGLFTNITPEYLIIKDQRDHIHQIPFSDLYEIILDRYANL